MCCTTEVQRYPGGMGGIRGSWSHCWLILKSLEVHSWKTWNKPKNKHMQNQKPSVSDVDFTTETQKSKSVFNGNLWPLIRHWYRAQSLQPLWTSVNIRLGHVPKRPCRRPRQCSSALCCFPLTPRVTFSDHKWQFTQWNTKSQGRLVHVEMNFASTGFYMFFGSNYSDIPCLFTSCTCLNLSALGKAKSTDI